MIAARTHRPIGAVVDDALRVLLRHNSPEAGKQEWTFPTGGAGGLQPGVNLDNNEALAELLGDNAVS